MSLRTEYAFFSPEGKALKTTKSPIGADRGFLAMDNVWFARDEPDAIEPVPGYTLFNAVEILSPVQSGAGGAGGQSLRNMHFAYASNGNRMIVVGGDNGIAGSGEVYTVSTVSTTEGEWARIKVGLTNNKILSMAQLNDLVFFASGSDAVFDATIKPENPVVSPSGLERLDVSGAVSAQGTTANVDAVRGTVKYFVAPFDIDSRLKQRPDGNEGDRSDGWTNTSGSANEALFEDIDEAIRDDSDYVLTENIDDDGGTEDRYFTLSTAVDPATSVSHVVRYAYRSPREGADIDLETSLSEYTLGPLTRVLTISLGTHTSIPETWTLEEHTLETAEADSISDYSKLALYFKFTNNFASGSADHLPVSDEPGAEVGTWSPGSPFWSVVDDEGDTYQSNTSAEKDDRFSVKFSPDIEDPGVTTGHAVHFIAKVMTGSTGAVDFTLRQGPDVSGTITTQRFTGIGESEETKTITLTEADVNKITNYGNLRARFKPDTADQFDVEKIWLSLPGPTAEKAHISWAELQLPGTGEVVSLSEGPISEAFGEVDAEDGYEIDLTVVPLGDTGNVRLYRTYANGTNPFFLTSLGAGVGNGVPGQVAAYVDISPDIMLGDPPYNHGDPPLATYKAGIPFANRMWFIRDLTSLVDYSDLAEPESYWNNSAVGGNWLEVFGDDGDVCTALAGDVDGVLVFKRNHLYKIRGGSPIEFFVQQLTLSDSEVRSVGTPSSQSLVSTPSGVFFYWNKDFWQYTGTSIDRISKDIHEDLSGIVASAEALHVIVGYWHAERLVTFSVPLAGNTTEPTHTYLYDIANKRVVGRLTQGFRSFATIEDSTGATSFWASEGEANIGNIYKFDDGTDFNGTPIASSITLPSFYGHDITQQKRFLFVDLYFEPTTNSGENVDVTYEIDGISGSTTSVSLDTEDANNDRIKRRVNIGYIGRELRITVSSDGGTTEPPTWKLYGWNFGYHRLPGISN